MLDDLAIGRKYQSPPSEILVHLYQDSPVGSEWVENVDEVFEVGVNLHLLDLCRLVQFGYDLYHSDIFSR